MPEVIQVIPDVQIYACNRAGGARVELADATLVSMEWVLNDYDVMSFSIPKTSPQALYVAAVVPEIQLWINGTLVFWGVPWKKASTSSNNNRVYQVDGLFSYFIHRHVLTASLLYDTIDQATIFGNLVAAAQSGTNMDLGITYSVPTTGVTRNRTYDRTRHQAFYDMLKEFPTLSNGFDFAMVLTPPATRTLTTYYPTRGSRKGNFQLEWGKNIVAYGLNEDGTRVANRVYCTGATSGSTKWEGQYEDTAAQAALNNTVLDAVISDSQQKDPGWLTEEATRAVNQRKKPYKSLTVAASRYSVDSAGLLVSDLLMSVWPGDTLPIAIDDFDVQVNEDYRINKMKWAPTNDTISFDFVEAVVL